MKKITQKLNTPFLSCFLIVFFFILHTVNENTGLITFKAAITCLGWYLVLTAILLLFSLYVLFRKQPGEQKKNKASVYCTFLLILFFFFGYFHDALKTLHLPAVLTSYRVILSILFILIIAVAVIIKRSQKQFAKLNRFFNILFIIFTIPEIFLLPYNIFTNRELVNDYGDPLKKITTLYQPCIDCPKPDIYFIVFDGYTSSACLEQKFGYNNSAMDSFFIKNNFFVSKKSKSNYNITPFSVSSTLNFNYLRKDLSNKELTFKLIQQGTITLFRSEFPAILKKEGYIIKQYSGYSIKNQSKQKLYPAHSTKPIHWQTLPGRIERDILWNFYFRNPFNDIHKSLEKSFRKDIQETINDPISGLMKEIDSVQATPKFVYAHIMLPHEPYYFDEKGNFNFDSAMAGFNSKTLYVKQLTYTNSFIVQIVNKLMNNKKPAIVIIEGDHGFRYYTGYSEKNRIFDNLNTYYFPDHDYSSLYDSISPVNTFRIIMNKYFKQHFELLPDSSVYIRNPNFPFELNHKH